MKVFLMMVVMLGLAWFGSNKHKAPTALVPPQMSAAQGSATAGLVREPAPVASFRCDGRKHCSQMTSCAEATFFTSTCPGTKMDGDGDGVPCESQWCQ
ncbi:MAG: excalibur calcium-binding domain-containing protein [Pseudomonadota bacterium]|nr:excalibur calcium-binding domain-containing protein [Pseudomonadota bacterium]